MKQIGDIHVNDGKGLFDNAGMCDSLITDCNNAVKNICSGQYIQFCNTIIAMVQKITNLKKGIVADIEAKDKIIAEIEKHNAELREQVTGLSAGGD